MKMHEKNKKYLLNEIQTELLEQASCMVLNTYIDIPFIQELFSQLLDYHIYTNEMLDVLYPEYNTSAAFFPYFRKALQSIHYPIPENEQQARDIIIQYHLKRIVEQNYNPESEIYDMLCTIAGNEYPEDSSILAAAEPLYNAYITYDYNDYSPGANQLVYDNFSLVYTHETDHKTLESLAKQKEYLVEIAKKCLMKYYAKK